MKIIDCLSRATVITLLCSVSVMTQTASADTKSSAEITPDKTNSGKAGKSSAEVASDKAISSTANLSTSEVTQATILSTAKTSPKDIKPLLGNMVNKAILPLYAAADKHSSELFTQVMRFCASPNLPALKTTRQHWSQALSSWQASEVALFGPGLEQQRDLHIYFRPVKKRVIKRLLNQELPITLENLEFAGVGAQGFATLEYLLFDRDLSDSEILARFTGLDNRHCQHLLATTTLLQRDVSAINQSWISHYANVITHEKPTEKSNLIDPKQAMELILGKLDQLAETVPIKLRHALAKDAHLAGKDAARSKRNPHKLEAWRSGHTLANIQANISGIQQLIEAGGILAWLKSNQHSALAEKLQQQFKTIEAISFDDQDLFTQIDNKNLKAADQLYADSPQLSRLIKQVAPALGVQLGFNDSDGD